MTTRSWYETIYDSRYSEKLRELILPLSSSDVRVERAIRIFRSLDRYSDLPQLEEDAVIGPGHGLDLYLRGVQVPELCRIKGNVGEYSLERCGTFQECWRIVQNYLQSPCGSESNESYKIRNGSFLRVCTARSCEIGVLRIAEFLRCGNLRQTTFPSSLLFSFGVGTFCRRSGILFGCGYLVPGGRMVRNRIEWSGRSLIQSMCEMARLPK